MLDAQSFEAFYRENLARIVRACALVTLDRTMAEDVAAEAFARLWSRWGLIRGPDHAGGYVFKTAMRLCWKETRRRPPIPGPTGAEEETGRVLLRHDVARALAELPGRQRQAVVLRDWAGLDTSAGAGLARPLEGGTGTPISSTGGASAIRRIGCSRRYRQRTAGVSATRAW